MNLDKQDVEIIQSSFVSSTNNSERFLIKHMTLIKFQLLVEPLSQILNHVVLLNSRPSKFCKNVWGWKIRSTFGRLSPCLTFANIFSRRVTHRRNNLFFFLSEKRLLPDMFIKDMKRQNQTNLRQQIMRSRTKERMESSPSPKMKQKLSLTSCMVHKDGSRSSFGSKA